MVDFWWRIFCVWILGGGMAADAKVPQAGLALPVRRL
jgi:hypothetical protein